MTLDSQVIRILRDEPATFIDVALRIRADYGELDAAFQRLKRERRIKYDSRMGAWRAA